MATVDPLPNFLGVRGVDNNLDGEGSVTSGTISQESKKMRAVLAGLFLGVALFAGQRSQPKVYKIYVAEMHFPKNPDLDEFVRSKLISYLAQFCGPTCTVIDGAGSSGDDVAEKADGVLTGVVQIQETDQMRYRVQGAMRLVDKDGNVLWAATVYNSPFVRSATSSFAANTAKKLTTFLSRQ